MSLLQAVVLGLIEGLTEFLPISSTAHLVLSSELLHVHPTEAVKTFEIAIQFGAILAVVALEWKRLTSSTAVWTRVFAAFVPTALIGLFLHKIVKSILLESIATILWSLSIGGVLLIVFSLLKKERPTDVRNVEDISHAKAALIGLCQAVAIVPGVSRAAATIVGGELLGVSRKTIVEFSFLLAVPTIAAAAALDLMKSMDALSMTDLPLFLGGGSAAFITALLSIRWFLSAVKRLPFSVFGIERIAVAALFFLWWTL